MSESNSIEKFLEEFKNIQGALLDYLENDESIDVSFHNIKRILFDAKIRDCQHDIRLFFHLLLKVSNNRHRCHNFFNKIDKILQFFEDDLKKYDNREIFHLFKGNKRILLFLIEEKILTVDEHFVKQITKEKYSSRKYPHYFSPEIKPFIEEKWFPKFDPNDKNYEKNAWVEEIKKELPDDFYEMRKIGENENYICKLIREDSVVEFISYLSKKNIAFDEKIIPSIYETNSFLIKQQNAIELIEYAAFFGSIQIFNYLRNKEVKLTPSLWLDAIHCNNAEIIQILEDNQIEPLGPDMKESYKECIIESIKCHHNEFVNHFFQNYVKKEDENSSYIIHQILKNYNFAFIENDRINESSFCYLCHCDYYSLAVILLTRGRVNINGKAIQNHVFSMQFKFIFFNGILISYSFIKQHYIWQLKNKTLK